MSLSPECPKDQLVHLRTKMGLAVLTKPEGGMCEPSGEAERTRGD